MLFTEEGHLNEEGLAFYAEHLLRRELDIISGEITDHVMECSDCKFHCFELTEMLKLEQQTDLKMMVEKDAEPPGISEKHDKRGERRQWPRIFNLQGFKIAAAIIILAGVGWIIMNWMRDMKDENVKTAAVPPVIDSTENAPSAPVKTGIQAWVDKWARSNPASAMSYQTNAKLEAMMRMLFRSSDFQVVQPDSICETKYGEPLNFKWVDKKGKELTLRIMDQKGNLVHQRKLVHHLRYEVKKVLEPGLYYWFIEQSNYTVAGGRFGVVKDQ